MRGSQPQSPSFLKCFFAAATQPRLYSTAPPLTGQRGRGRGLGWTAIQRTSSEARTTGRTQTLPLLLRCNYWDRVALGGFMTLAKDWRGGAEAAAAGNKLRPEGPMWCAVLSAGAVRCSPVHVPATRHLLIGGPGVVRSAPAPRRTPRRAPPSPTGR